MFLILSLPRSRSSWLAHYLGYPLAYPPKLVGHNILGECDTVEKFLGSFKHGMAGTVEPCGAHLWRIVRQELPECKIVLVRRPLIEVHRSALNSAIPANLVELAEMDMMLDAAASDPWMVSIPYNMLSKPFIGKWLFESLLELEFDFEWWMQLVGTRVQMEVHSTMARWEHHRKNSSMLAEDLKKWNVRVPAHLN